MSNSITNNTLTTYAAGLMPNIDFRLADFIAPVVATGASHGFYKSFSDKNAFQALNAERATGGARTRVQFEDDDVAYQCRAYGLEFTIDDIERAAAGENLLGMEQSKLQALISNMVITREKKVFDTVKAAVSATGSVGVWSTTTVDPIAEIDSVIDAIATATGTMPNRIALGTSAWRALKNHVLVRDRFPGSPVAGITMEQLKGLFLNPDIEVRVGYIPADTKKLGVAKVNTNIVGSECFVFIGNDAPNLYDPSAVKTLRVNQYGFEGVKQYRDETRSSDVYALDWMEQVVVASTASIARITVS